MNYKILAIGILITVLAFYLRFQQFYSFPVPADTYDEYKSVFNGISLIKEGTPKSWSWLEQYKNTYRMTVAGNTVQIVWPWFDEPPLFGLILGSYSLARGMDTFEKVDLAVLRHPFVYLGALTSLLLFFLVWKVSGAMEAIISSLLYATVPIIVLSSRLPLVENLITATSLLSLILTVFYLKNKKLILLLLLSLVAASAFLMKAPGIFVPISVMGLLIVHGLKKPAIVVGAFLLGAVAIWIGFGAYYDWNLFTAVSAEHNARSLTYPLNIVNLFEVFRITERAMHVDGWLIWGWIAAVLYSYRSQEKNLLSRFILPLSLGSYLIIFMIMNGQIKGWYRFPFYPFLCWAMSAVFLETFRNPRLLLGFFFTSIPLASSYFYGSGQWMWRPSESKMFQPAFLLLSSPFVLYEIWPKRFMKIARIMVVILFIVAILFNITTILMFQDQFWY